MEGAEGLSLVGWLGHAHKAPSECVVCERGRKSAAKKLKKIKRENIVEREGVNGGGWESLGWTMDQAA